MEIRKKIFLLLCFCLALFLFIKCKSDTQRGGSAEEKTDDSLEAAYNPATDTTLTPEIGVMDWSEAMNKKDYKKLERMYADEVDLYGRHLSRNDVVAIKIEFLRQNPTYTQFLSDIEIEDYTPEAVKAKFTKQTIINKNPKSYDSYLIMERGKYGWKIVAEGDSTSTHIVTSKENNEIKKKEIKTCDDAAEAIFLSASVVQNLLNEKYVRYKIEYKPGAKDNPNNRYWFWVFAVPPSSDMTQTYGRFQVDPKSGQLYEYKVTEDKAVPVDFDKGLLKQFNKHCGS